MWFFILLLVVAVAWLIYQVIKLRVSLKALQLSDEALGSVGFNVSRIFDNLYGRNAESDSGSR